MSIKFVSQLRIQVLIISGDAKNDIYLWSDTLDKSCLIILIEKKDIQYENLCYLYISYF